MKKNCVVCGVEFESRGPNAKACGETCRKRRFADLAKTKRNASSFNTCVMCGGLFPNNGPSKTCGKVCSVARAKWRAKENSHKSKIYSAKWRYNNPEAMKRSRANWRKNNSARDRENGLRWRIENLDRVADMSRANQRKRRIHKYACNTLILTANLGVST